MAIEKIECIAISCDNCGNMLESSEGFTIFMMESDIQVEDSDWIKDGESHYCDKCHYFNDDDKLIIDQSRRKHDI